MRVHNAISRSVMVAALACFGTLAVAQAPNPALTVKKVKDNIYFVEGGGGNSSIIIGQNGVIVVDVKTTVAAGKGVVDEVTKLTNKPITTVIWLFSSWAMPPARRPTASILCACRSCSSSRFRSVMSQKMPWVPITRPSASRMHVLTTCTNSLSAPGG